MIVFGEILHLQVSFQGALGFDDCVRYRCNLSSGRIKDRTRETAEIEPNRSGVPLIKINVLSKAERS